MSLLGYSWSLCRLRLWTQNRPSPSKLIIAQTNYWVQWKYSTVFGLSRKRDLQMTNVFSNFCYENSFLKTVVWWKTQQERYTPHTPAYISSSWCYKWETQNIEGMKKKKKKNRCWISNSVVLKGLIILESCSWKPAYVLWEIEMFVFPMKAVAFSNRRNSILKCADPSRWHPPLLLYMRFL